MVHRPKIPLPCLRRWRLYLAVTLPATAPPLCYTPLNAPYFDAFAKAGKRLAELHVDYEKQKEYPLERQEKAGKKLDPRGKDAIKQRQADVGL